MAKLLEKPEVRAEVERLNREEYALLDQMLAARKEAGMSQADVAAKMGTKAAAISRLESALASGKHSPSIDTLRRYAEATGKILEIRFIPKYSNRSLFMNNAKEQSSQKVTNALYRFKQRLDYFYDDVDLVDVIDKYREKQGLNNLMNQVEDMHTLLSRREKKNTTLKNILFQSAGNGYSLDRIVGEHKCSIDIRLILATKIYEEVIKIASDDMFKQLKSERSTIKLINKISNKIGLNINKDFINKSIPYLELIHLLVYNDGELTEEFKKYAINVPVNSKKKISPTHEFMMELRKNIENLITEMDKSILNNKLLKDSDIRS